MYNEKNIENESTIKRIIITYLIEMFKGFASPRKYRTNVTNTIDK